MISVSQNGALSGEYGLAVLHYMLRCQLCKMSLLVEAQGRPSPDDPPSRYTGDITKWFNIQKTVKHMITLAVLQPDHKLLGI